MTSSHNQPMPPPIRTNTASSQTTQSSKSSTSQLSPPHSPASATSTSRSVSSPTEASFFGAITARIRVAYATADTVVIAVPTWFFVDRAGETDSDAIAGSELETESSGWGEKEYEWE
ncbi:hypothetical protein PtrSN002B_004754 [Pyrenophora tritici-repentis]|nr:hypothetical protein PtrV1_00680 [Pyrenophora tritici-repentis]KAF7453392.1 hypothetical protein A1F99_006500 [Pyrenophora tritici-repentis]KAG9387145.1 hypothetical protein A1F94_000037 [Pyrenophora tritici-repentis]KAI1538918.1 hypothetical protein PtrSN001A_004742 [Pyrenophora tritici-repentis]KAI1547267.1 hypothetical protein PtrSN001C_002488 [Pyrenophora tritici-repentis]